MERGHDHLCKQFLEYDERKVQTWIVALQAREEKG